MADPTLAAVIASAETGSTHREPGVEPADDVPPRASPQPSRGPAIAPSLEGRSGSMLPPSIVPPESGGGPAPQTVSVPTLDGLPAYRLSTPTGFEQDRTGRVHWQRATYLSDRGAQVLRQHYRTVLRARGWRITRNEPLARGMMLLTASRGPFEATIRIVPLADGTLIRVMISEIMVSPEPPAPDPDRVIVRQIAVRQGDRLPRSRPDRSGSDARSAIGPAAADTGVDRPRVSRGVEADDGPQKRAKGEKDHDGDDRRSKHDPGGPDRDKAPRRLKDKPSRDKVDREDRHSRRGHRDQHHPKPPKAAKAGHGSKHHRHD
jgi:hypothetical protein